MKRNKWVGVLVVGLVLGLSASAPARIIVAEKLLVDLRAADLAYGVVETTWRNNGTLDDFTAKGTPIVEDVDGRKAVTFDGSSYFEGPLSVAGIQGNGTRSIEVWAYNGPDFVAEETMVSWSHRGGPDYTNMVFNYGNSTSWGAAAHWGGGDMPWAGEYAPAPAANTWWYLVYTYDGAAVRIYVNGVENTSKAMTLNSYGPNIIRVAAQADSTGAAAFTSVNFTGSIAEVRIHDGVLSPADIANNFVSKVSGPIAKVPSPDVEATEVLVDTVLSWEAGPYAVTHDVYLGTALADVNDASRDNPMGVLVSQDQAETVYDPEGLFEYGQTYYWRVDEVNGAPDYTIHKGDVWSFTTEPYAYPITNLTVKASAEQGTSPAVRTIDGSGMNEFDEHGVELKNMWVSPSGLPAWIQFEFETEYNLHELWVWNSNSELEAAMGFGAKDVVVEYSTDGATWTAVENVPEFAQGTSVATYTANTVVSFGGARAKYVKLTINDNWGTSPMVSLSEVRFFYVPAQAFSPEPSDGATVVSVASELDWRPGRAATSHTVYFGTDANAVAAGAASSETVTDHGYAPALDFSTTYYWRVDEVGETTAYPGEVWSFTTEDYAVVEDFEGYTDDQDADEAIFQTWIDGYDDDNNGSLVGYIDPPFAEQTVVHGGKQSMPLAYDNTGGVAYSEATRTFGSSQDWTRSGITSLVLYFRGQVGNAPAPLYVKINNTKVSYNDGVNATTMGLWKQWTIPLSETGATLKSVKSLTIGVAGSGAGTMFFDDIRLYAAAPESVSPVDPGTSGLLALYTLDGNVQDSSGKKYDGTITGNMSYEDGYAGQGLVFNGVNSYVDLPIGPMIATLTDTTIATHIKFGGGSGSWQRVWDFGSGSGTSPYMFLCPRQGTSGPLRFAIRTATVSEQVVNTEVALSEGSWQHVAVTIDSVSMTASIYLDGALVASGATVLLPKDLGETTQNWLGRSQYAVDGYFLGSLDDFRIYNRVLSEAELRYLAGDR